MVEITKCTNRRFGVEIEFRSTAIDSLAHALTAAGVETFVEHYNHTTRPHWKIVSDASCGYEIVSPILQGESGLYQLERVCEIMQAENIQISRSTGVHVHLEAADLTRADVATIVKRYHENERTIDTWFPVSRRGTNNTYCRPVARSINMTRLDQGDAEGPARQAALAQNIRFGKVNLQSLTAHGTIEFRQHAGSTDFAKIGNWVLFLMNFVEHSRKLKNSRLERVRGDRKRWYAEIRNEVERMGGTVKYHRGLKKWLLTGTTGSTALDNNGMASIYNRYSINRDTHKTTGRMVRFRPDQWKEVLDILFGEEEITDNSLNAGIPEEVVDWFTLRAADLAA